MSSLSLCSTPDSHISYSHLGIGYFLFCYLYLDKYQESHSHVQASTCGFPPLNLLVTHISKLHLFPSPKSCNQSLFLSFHHNLHSIQYFHLKYSLSPLLLPLSLLNYYCSLLDLSASTLTLLQSIFNVASWVRFKKHKSNVITQTLQKYSTLFRISLCNGL